MVDAFIKYGNLLNGLWQSHWRSLFRCRWLPAYWLPLTVADACHEKRESCSLLFLCLFVFFSIDWQLITNAVCLRTRLTVDTLPKTLFWLTLFSIYSVKSLLRANYLSARLLHIQHTVWRQIVMTVIKQNGRRLIETVSLKSRAATHNHSLPKEWDKLFF